MSNERANWPERLRRNPPMSDEQYEAFYRRANERFGVKAAAAEAAGRGVILMVRSLEPPHYAIPYPDFAEQVRARQLGESLLGVKATERTVSITPYGATRVMSTGSLGLDAYPGGVL
jgi:hypothetical protein